MTWNFKEFKGHNKGLHDKSSRVIPQGFIVHGLSKSTLKKRRSTNMTRFLHFERKFKRLLVIIPRIFLNLVRERKTAANSSDLIAVGINTFPSIVNCL